VFVGVAFLISGFFTVKIVECQMLSGDACPEELTQSLTLLHGESMFFKDYSQKLRNSQTLAQPVSLVQFKKMFPQTVIIIFQAEPAAYTIQHNGETTVVSKTGRIFTHPLDVTGLMSVEVPGDFITSDGFINTTIHQTLLSIIDTSAELAIPLTKITWVDKSTIQLSIENRTEIFIIDSERPTLELHKLTLVLKSGEYRDIAKPKHELDLRFTMPVLRTRP
jgi:hypothetical protein